MLGGPEGFDKQIIDWFDQGKFDSEPGALAEAFTCACMLGRVKVAKHLLDSGIDPYTGMKTGLSGFHYAASGGRLEIIKLLIERKVPMEIKGMYDNTVLGQALWCAVNEHTDNHAEIVELLINAGAYVWPGMREWWNSQEVPDKATKERIAKVLKEHAEFHSRVDAAREEVAKAESKNNKRALADALRSQGNILRRPPFLRDAATEAYTRAAGLYRELNLPLEEAWVKRHIGINHEYAERLTEAEKYYDEALALYRENAIEDSLDYANAVRYPAVIKNRLGKHDESEALWREALDRYEKVGIADGIVEGKLHMANFALRRGDLNEARIWLEKAKHSAEGSDNMDTHKFVAEVEAKLKQVEE
jgi:tetratricopeptide (TPR) repeat protein